MFGRYAKYHQSAFDLSDRVQIHNLLKNTSENAQRGGQRRLNKQTAAKWAVLVFICCVFVSSKVVREPRNFSALKVLSHLERKNIRRINTFLHIFATHKCSLATALPCNIPMDHWVWLAVFRSPHISIFRLQFSNDRTSVCVRVWNERTIR